MQMVPLTQNKMLLDCYLVRIHVHQVAELSEILNQVLCIKACN
jgi:hypothetical protein